MKKTMAVLALLLAGCSGDVVPLEEAVEVGQLGLDSLSIPRPADTLTPLVINPGEALQFSLEGLDANGGEVEVDGAGRRWRVADSNVATIDANGRLVGVADGSTTVDVRIGDVVAGAYDVRVSRAAATSVIEIDGADAVDPCVVERYVAYGGFADDTERLLRDVEWSVPEVGTELVSADDGSATLSGRSPNDAVELVARVNQASLSKPITVNASLTALTLGSSASLTLLTTRVGSTLDLSVVGTYDDSGSGVGVDVGDDSGEVEVEGDAEGETEDEAEGEAGGEVEGEAEDEAEGEVAMDAEGAAGRQLTVTDGVELQVASGSEFASFVDDAENPGRIRGDAAGNATVQAVCGEIVSEARQLVVSSGSSSTNGSSSGDGSGLSFEDADGASGEGDGGELTVFLNSSQGGVQLRVSTSSPFDEDEEVTNGVIWDEVGEDDEFESLAGSVSSTGFFTPSFVGSVQITAQYRGFTSTLTINVR